MLRGGSQFVNDCEQKADQKQLGLINSVKLSILGQVEELGQKRTSKNIFIERTLDIVSSHQYHWIKQ